MKKRMCLARDAAECGCLTIKLSFSENRIENHKKSNKMVQGYSKNMLSKFQVHFSVQFEETPGAFPEPVWP